MLTKLIILLFIINVTLKVATAKPIEEDKSLMDKLKYKHENGTWTCFDVKCPVDTFGCKINLFTDKKDRNVLYQSFKCLGKDKNMTRGAGDMIKLSEPKIIDMALEVYYNMESLNTSGNDTVGNGSAKVQWL